MDKKVKYDYAFKLEYVELVVNKILEGHSKLEKEEILASLYYSKISN